MRYSNNKFNSGNNLQLNLLTWINLRTKAENIHSVGFYLHKDQWAKTKQYITLLRDKNEYKSTNSGRVLLLVGREKNVNGEKYKGSFKISNILFLKLRQRARGGVNE